MEIFEGGIRSAVHRADIVKWYAVVIGEVFRIIIRLIVDVEEAVGSVVFVVKAKSVEKLMDENSELPTEQLAVTRHCLF